MADRWYYSHDLQKIGPCSGQQLKDLAACGRILPTDTVWKEGIEGGVNASKVKNLFRPVFSQTPVEVPVAEAPSPVVEPVTTAPRAEAAPAGPVLAKPPVETAPVPAAGPRWQPRKGRATAGRGAVVVSQDGVNVKYRKKCTTCEYVDSSWNTMPIRNGVMRVGFYCIKCRKHRDVEVHGSLN